MKTLVVANQKGGVGKTATLVHLAFDFYERGLRVAVVDLDTQGNASFTLSEHQVEVSASQLFFSNIDGLLPECDGAEFSPCLHLIPSDSKLANLEGLSMKEVASAFSANIERIKANYDVLLVDTAPSLGVGMYSALMSADYVLSPIEMETYSILGIEKMVRTIANVRRSNPALKFIGMMPSKMNNNSQRHKNHLAEIQAMYPTHIIPASIGLRSSVADALATKCPVWQIKKTAARVAAKEVRAVAEFVHSKMEISK